MSKLMPVLIFLFVITSCSPDDASNSKNQYDLLRDVSAITENGSVNVVIEIPAGSTEKWEVVKTTGELEWERINPDSLRQVKYLPYPANYGFIPRTWLSASDGGDDDPLDVILIGASVPRGSVVESHVLGVIRMLDRGEQDDKLIAVATDGPFWYVHTLEELQTRYPGIIEILTTWLANYKGEGFVEIESVENELIAREILDVAIEWFESVPDPYL
jgi:inorganic pyrophosphatase